MPQDLVSTAASLEAKLRAGYTRLPAPGGTVPRYLQVKQWIRFGQEYLDAAEYLSTRPVPLFNPWFQLIGHAIECSLKAYLCAMQVRLGKEHDLVKLTDQALGRDLELPEHDVATLVHVSHAYSSDLRSNTRYKSRYPTDQMEYSGGSAPTQERLSAIVLSVQSQASAVNEKRNAPKDPAHARAPTR